MMAASCVPQESDHLAHLAILTDCSRVASSGASPDHPRGRNRQQGNDRHKSNSGKEQRSRVVLRSTHEDCDRCREGQQNDSIHYQDSPRPWSMTVLGGGGEPCCVAQREEKNTH